MASVNVSRKQIGILYRLQV